MNQPRIDRLFEKTKTLCFGRFVVDVPASAAVINGPQTVGGTIKSLPNGVATLHGLVSKRVAELQAVKHEDVAGSMLRQVVDGPTPDSKTVISWASSHATYLTSVQGYLGVSPHGFIYEGGVGSLGKRKLDDETTVLQQIATHLRARDPADIPKEPGVCLDVGFIADDTGKFQEIFGIGLRFPELPDASFSISTNKDAQQGDSFDARRAEARRAALMVPELASAFSKIKTLREGKRKVQQGDGSEALFSRPLDGAPGRWHEFQFEYAGKRFDHRNPSWDAALFTGVQRDQAGSVASGLSDDEAIALWDRLMSSVRLRVVK